MLAGWKHIRYKLVVIFLLLIVSILAAVVFTTYLKSTRIIREQSVSLNDRLVEMGRSNLDESIEDVNKLFRSFYVNNDFKEYIISRRTDDQYSFISTCTNVENIMHTFINTRKDIFSILYVDINGFAIYATRNEVGHDRYFDTAGMPDWFQEALDSLYEDKGQRLILPTRGHIPLDFSATDLEEVYTISRAILDIDHGFEPIGALFIQMNLSALNEITGDIQPYGNSFSYIFDNNGQIVYDSSGQKTAGVLDADILAQFDRDKGNQTIDMDGTAYVAVYDTCQSVDWKIVNFVPVRQYSAQVADITRTVAIISILAILIAVIITYFASRGISNPIEKLSRAMDAVELSNMDVAVDISQKDEIGHLSRNFQSLIHKLKRSIQKEYETHLRQKDAQMKALQAQTNPHFLYNVLQSISSIAMVHHVGEINTMAKSLGKMLRYSIKTRDYVVTIADEVEHVRHYLSIQKIRFGDKLTYSIHVPEYLAGTPVLKLILQPLVENAIIHGFEGKDGEGVVHLSCQRDRGCLLCTVSDNGKGIGSKEMDALLAELRQEDTGFYTDGAPGIGLKNMATRLRMFYGEDFDFEIESEEGKGTTIQLRIPIQRGEAS